MAARNRGPVIREKEERIKRQSDRTKEDISSTADQSEST